MSWECKCQRVFTCVNPVFPDFFRYFLLHFCTCGLQKVWWTQFNTSIVFLFPSGLTCILFKVKPSLCSMFQTALVNSFLFLNWEIRGSQSSIEHRATHGRHQFDKVIMEIMYIIYVHTIMWVLDEGLAWLHRTLTKRRLPLCCCVLPTQRRSHKYTNNHHIIYSCVQIAIGCLLSTSIPRDATAGGADRGHNVVWFWTLFQTWVGYTHSNGEENEYFHCIIQENTFKALLPFKTQTNS